MRITAALLLVMLCLGAYGQQVGVGTLNPHPSALVEMKSSSSGLLIPRLTTAQRNAITNPAHSLLIFNVDNFCLEAYDSIGGVWLAVSCPIACSPCDTCPLPIIDSIVGPDSVCPGEIVQFTLFGTGGMTYIWNLPSGWSVINMAQQGEFIAASPGTIYGHLCNECGCVTDSVSIVAGTAPATVGLLSQDSVCLGDTLIVNVTGGNSYNWYVPLGWTVVYQGDSLIVVPTDTGSFHIGAEACNGCGCSPKDSIMVVVVDTVVAPVSIVGPAIVCAGDTVVWRATNAGTTLLNWQYPISWQLVSQGGDSIVLVADTTDGAVIVSNCSVRGCKCLSDTLQIRADSCSNFCIAIGGSGNDEGFDVALTSSGELMVVGYTSSFSVNRDIYVIKLSATGNLIWSKAIDGGGDELGASIKKSLNTETFFVSGHYFWSRGLFMKIDSSGNVIWSYESSFPNLYNWGNVVDQWGNIIAMGETSGPSSSNDDMSGVKLDTAGNLLASVRWGTSALDEAFGAYPSGVSNSYYIVGRTRAGYIGSADLVVLKTDTAFNIIWSTVIGGSSNEDGYGIIETSDGNVVAVGYTRSFGSGGYDVYIVKLDSSGNVLWTKVIGGAGHDLGYSIIEDSDGNLVIAGSTNSAFSAGGYDLYVIKMDQQGNVLWTKTIGGSGNEGDPFWMGGYNYGTPVRIVEHLGGYVLVSSTTSYGNGGKDVYVVRISKNGTLTGCSTGCIVGTGGNIQSGGTVFTGLTKASGTGLQNTSLNATLGGTVIKICP